MATNARMVAKRGISYDLFCLLDQVLSEQTVCCVRMACQSRSALAGERHVIDTKTGQRIDDGIDDGRQSADIAHFAAALHIK